MLYLKLNFYQFFQILSAHTTEELKVLLDSEEFEFRFDAGVTTPSAALTLQDQKQVAISMAMHFLVYTTKAELDQLKDGLGHLGVLDLMHTFPSQMKPLFLASGKPKVSALSLIAMFEIEWSPQGSNQREAEEAVVFGWTEYIHDMEGELWNIFGVCELYH